MPPETAHPIDKGNVYKDTDNEYINYVRVEGFYVNKAGRTQVKVSQYTNLPIAAHNSAAFLTGVSGHRTLEVNDVRDRILKGELIFEKVD